MSEELHAAAYIKLQENVEQMVVDAIKNELSDQPFGVLAQKIRWIIKEELNQEIKQYRVTRVGQTASY